MVSELAELHSVLFSALCDLACKASSPETVDTPGDVLAVVAILATEALDLVCSGEYDCLACRAGVMHEHPAKGRKENLHDVEPSSRP